MTTPTRSDSPEALYKAHLTAVRRGSYESVETDSTPRSLVRALANKMFLHMSGHVSAIDMRQWIVTNHAENATKALYKDFYDNNFNQVEKKGTNMSVTIAKFQPNQENHTC